MEKTKSAGKSAQKGVPTLHKSAAKAVESIDIAMENVSALAHMREAGHMSSSRVKSVARELGELRKVLAKYLSEPENEQSVNTVSTGC